MKKNTSVLIAIIPIVITSILLTGICFGDISQKYQQLVNQVSYESLQNERDFLKTALANSYLKNEQLQMDLDKKNQEYEWLEEIVNMYVDVDIDDIL